MNIDDEFYKFQTNIRGKFTINELKNLCENEYARINKILEYSVRKYGLRKSNLKAIDVPCGYGNILYTLNRMNIENVGYDLDVNQIELAKSLKLNAKRSDFFDLEINEKYDLITSFDFIEHLEKNNSLKVLLKFANMLNDKGLLIIRTPCGDSPLGLKDFSDDPTHKWIGSYNCIVSMLKIAGFSHFEVLEDWPYSKKYGTLRKIFRTITTPVFRLLLCAIGYGRPVCLSPSMIILATK